MISFRVPALPLAALAIIAVTAVAACRNMGTGNLNPVTPVAPAVVQPATTAAVTIDGFAFHPKTITIEVGTTVKWTNRQNIDHTVTANNGSFNSGHIKPGHSFSHMFKSTGKFPYHCMIHTFMHGEVNVTP
jgi:plastocyanin